MDKHPVSTTEVRVACDAIQLVGDLAMPADPHGIVVFAHGSGSGRHSSRNRAVARRLQDAGLATLLLDLLTPEEDSVDQRTRHLRFDIPLLSRRMEAATAWVDQQQALRAMPLGYFGASTGSAAALIAAARLGRRVGAVVSRGGRPDLAGPAVLAAVTAPTLLVVGADDTEVLALNTTAFEHLRAPRRLSVIPGATHLFEEPGTL
ncbi:MAG: dienelactone hydrolase family protein, partial [Ramlibacter sp.]